MSNTTTVNIRMDTDLKREMEAVCRELGCNLTTAITMFAKKMTREHRIPFDVDVDPFYGAANQRYLAEARQQVDAGTANLAEHNLIEP